jgi:hypothetical protein
MPSAVRLVRLTLVSNSLSKDEAILHAYECLRESGIQPLGCELIGPSISIEQEKRGRALAALLAAGFEIKEY